MIKANETANKQMKMTMEFSGWNALHRSLRYKSIHKKNAIRFIFVCVHFCFGDSDEQREKCGIRCNN